MARNFWSNLGSKVSAAQSATNAATQKVEASMGMTTGSNQGFGIGSNMGPSGDVGIPVSKPSSGGTTTSNKGHSGSGGKIDSGSGNNAAGKDTTQNTKPSGDNDYAWWQMHYGVGNSGGSGGSGDGSGGGSSAPSGTDPNTGSVNGGAAAGEAYDVETGKPKGYKLPTIDGPNPERIEHVDTETLKNMLQQIVDTQRQQTEQKTDYTVENGIKELTRALEDAAKQYDTQRNQAAADEAVALDNQALYAEARGDRGGIGQAQYASIQNTAAMNRRAVNDAQVKLSTDTARQIEDLRAQGEFEKADNLLSLTQSHLSQLMNLEQWAMQTNLGVDEFNSQLQQWVDEYKLKAQEYLTNLDLAAAQITGMFADGTRTAAAQEKLTAALAQSGNALLQSGVMPTEQQLKAMGMTAEQARLYLRRMGF